MADPITLTGLAIGSLLGAGGAALTGAFSGKGATVTPPTALPPDPSTPAQTPPSKPAAKTSQQQSFLSGAASLQQAGGAAAGTGGKSLLGQ